MKDFRNMEVLRISRRLLLDVYRLTGSFSDAHYNVANEIRSQCIRLVTGIAVAFEANPKFPDLDLLAVAVATASALSENCQNAAQSGIISQAKLGQLSKSLLIIRTSLINLALNSDLN